MNELTVFDEREVLGKEFRMYGTVEQPLFLARDVAEWIDYSWTNSKKTARCVGKMLESVDEEEKIKAILGMTQSSTPSSHGGLRENTEMWFLTEDGLYEVLMQSRKPIAKEFKKEVKKILKTIRKTGGYVSNDEQFINTYLPFADDNTKLLFRTTLHTINEQNRIIQQQKETIIKKDVELDHKEDVIIGLTEDIDLAEKRQRITQIIRHNANGKYSERYGLLYKEYEMKYHVDINRRMDGAKDRGEIKKSMKKMEYICDVMNHTAELYEIACKVFENDVDELIKLWKETI